MLLLTFANELLKAHFVKCDLLRFTLGMLIDQNLSSMAYSIIDKASLHRQTCVLICQMFVCYGIKLN